MNNLNLSDQQRSMAVATAKTPMSKAAIAYVFGLEAELMTHHRPVVEISREEPFTCEIIKPEQVEYVFNWHENFYIKYFPSEQDTAEVEDEDDKIWQDEVEALEEEPDDRRKEPRRRPGRDQEKSQEQLDAMIADGQIRAHRERQEKELEKMVSDNKEAIATQIYESISQVGDIQHIEREINIQDEGWPKAGLASDLPQLTARKAKGYPITEPLRRDMVTLLQLARIKWGNADPDVDQVLQAITEKYGLD